MGVEENIRVVEVWGEANNAHDWEGMLELATESVVRRGPEGPEPMGREELLRFLEETGVAFPDHVVEVERLFGQGEWVCGEFRLVGTHTGPLTSSEGETIPATGKDVRLPFCAVFRLEGGKIAEYHVYYDNLGFMAQLGLIPS